MLKGIITGQKLTLKDIPLIVSDSIDYLEAVFAFRSKDWEECEKWAHFSQGDVVYDIKLTDNKIRKKDHLNLDAGSWKIYLHGTSKTGMRITTDPVSFGVKKSGVLNGQPLPEIPLSVAENLDLRLSFLEEVGGYPSGVSPYIISEAKSENILLTDSAKAKLRGLKLYGKSTQDGTPSPENPVEIVSAGADGEIVVTIDGETPQTLTALTPNGLPGYKVKSGGNWTDSTGQQWLCDEIDFDRGVYIHWVLLYLFTGAEKCIAKTTIGTYTKYAFWFGERGSAGKGGLYSRGTYGWHNNDASHAYMDGNNLWLFLPFDGDANAYLTAEAESGKPIEVLYALESPVETPLTEEEMAQYAALHTNYPTTTILNDEGVGMEVSYVADTKNYIDKKFTELAAAIVANA